MPRLSANKRQSNDSPDAVTNTLTGAAGGQAANDGLCPSDRQETAGVEPPVAFFNPTLLGDIRYWLDWQSRMISGVVHASIQLYDLPATDTLSCVATWPEGAFEPEQIKSLGQRCVAAGDVVSQTDRGLGSDRVDCLSCPVTSNGTVIGAVSFALHPRSETQRDAVIQLIQWCVVWLQKRLTTAESQTGDSQSAVINALSLLTEEGPLPVTGMQLCGYLAEKFSCSLVAMGLPEGLHIRTVAVSHQVIFDRKIARFTEFERAMEECADQRKPIQVPPGREDQGTLVQAHTIVRDSNRKSVVQTVPILYGESICAVLILLKPNDSPFSRQHLTQLFSIASQLGPVIHLQQTANQTVLQRAVASLKRFASKLSGKRITRFKVVVAATVFIPVLLALIPATHRVTATAMLEGAMQQAIAAPVDGYVKSVHVRAGDSVSSEQLLATLDDSELTIEYQQWLSEKDKLNKEYQQAWASRNKAQVSILAAKIEQADTRLELTGENLQRTKIQAPFDGMLISGDLSQQVGAPVERGQLLFQIVPLEGYKVILMVDEYDIGKIELEQPGKLRLSSMPEEVIDIKVVSIFPLATNEQGNSFFRVEAQLMTPPDSLRPGMQGVAKIEVGDASLASVWTQSLRERLGLYSWYLGF